MIMTGARFHSRYFILFIIASVILLTGCRKRSMEGMIIITETTSIEGNPDFVSGESWRYIPQTRLLSFDPGHPDISPEVLTQEFYSARSPEVSCEGTHLLFSGQKNQNDPWQIWEMELAGSEVHQVTNAAENSVDPAYLPGGRIVFSRELINDSLKAGHALFTCNLNGTDLRRITFNPSAYFASTVLMDGRILVISRQLFPETEEPSLMVLRPDGTKAELFYKGDGSNELFSRSWESKEGKIVFLETDSKKSGKAAIVSIRYNRPLHSRTDLTGSLTGYYQSVSPLNNGRLLVSWSPDEKELPSLYEFDPEKMILGKQLYKGTDGKIIEAVEVNVQERPRKLPSEVDPGVKTGLLLCQNINISGLEPSSGNYSVKAADRIEVIGIDSSLGVVEVDKDGSFYLKVTADIPFRIRTLNSKGEVVDGPGSWYWVRPNERRGCVGCHEDQEMTPSNRYSLAVGKQPVAVPVHLKGVKEKEVELE
jgi:hypothetical protein